MIGWSIDKQTPPDFLSQSGMISLNNYMFTFTVVTDVVHAHTTIIHSEVGVWIIVNVYLWCSLGNIKYYS